MQKNRKSVPSRFFNTNIFTTFSTLSQALSFLVSLKTETTLNDVSVGVI